MPGQILPTTGRRFLRVLGFALLQAAIFGSLVGALVYFRAPRAVLDPSGESTLTFRQRLAAPLVALERESLDWRARELGQRSQPLDSVLLASIDEETLANAREDVHPQVATRPWARELLGRMVGLLHDEGAKGVLLDLAFPDLSPRSVGKVDDDEAFRRLLDQSDVPTVLTFAVSAAAPPPMAHPLRPYLVRLGSSADGLQVDALLQRALADRRPAFAIPRGHEKDVWVGVSSEEEGRAVSRASGVKGAATVREFAAADRAHQVTAVDLLVHLAEVRVDGLDPDELFQVKTINGPAAPLLGHGSSYGFSDLSPDSDGVVRGVLQLVRYVGPDGQSHVLPSAALAATLQQLPKRTLRYSMTDGRLFLGDASSISMDPTGYCLLQWEAGEPAPGGRGSIAHAASVWRLLRNLFDVESGVPPHYGNEVGARAVVLTDTSAGESGWVNTSIGASVAPGAVWAQSMANLIGSGGIRAVTPTHDLYVTFLLAFVGAFLALSFSGLVRSLFGSFIYVASLALVFTAYVLYARHLYVDQHRWVAMAGPLAALLGSFGATTIYALRTEAEMYDFVYGALGRYVSPKVARQVLRNVAVMRPERRNVSVCYTDLEGFGRMLDALSPEETVTLLNEYLTEITAVVRQHGGQVEYAGDAVLAFFGAPLKIENHAQAACAAALGLRAALLARQPDWEKRFGHKVDCRTGVCSGEVLAGDLGSRLKSNYTVMGEPVTLARRLEGANRTYSTHLLVADATQAIASDEFVFRETDLVSLRGTPVRIYELVDRRESVTAEMLGRLAQFDTALRHYRGRRFKEALPLFRELGESDPVARVYLERAQVFLTNPPPAEWSGLGDLRRSQTRA